MNQKKEEALATPASSPTATKDAIAQDELDNEEELIVKENLFNDEETEEEVETSEGTQLTLETPQKEVERRNKTASAVQTRLLKKVLELSDYFLMGKPYSEEGEDMMQIVLPLGLAEEFNELLTAAKHLHSGGQPPVEESEDVSTEEF